MSIDYKTTLHMPNTDFKMKANLSQKESLIQKKWIDIDLENLVYIKNSDKEKFIIHDGPPYANGDLHIGHALNKILKDFIVRYKNMSDFLSIYIAGWDTHGMPIEIALQKKEKISDLSIIEKRNKCKDFANFWIDIQKKQFISMGLFTNFKNIYKTLDTSFEINQIKIFFKMLNNKLIYKSLKPIYWSWSSQTALAEAEVEYENVESDSIYFTFEVFKSKILEKGDKLLVWTTTPWTIPSNLAISIHPNFEYLKVKTNIGNLILIKNDYMNLLQKLNIEFYSIIKEFKGSELEYDEYYHPLYKEKINKIILAKYINLDGTGIVHNAPGFGNDDYLACKKYSIDVFCPIDALGKFTNEINDSELEGQFYSKTNQIIIDRLINNKLLVKNEKIIHSVAHDWRTKKPIIYRSTDQWFVNLFAIKDKLDNALSKVHSKQGDATIKKIKEMIDNRQEWCISRQRYWGVPIPIIYDEKGEPIVDELIQKNILDIFNTEGTNSWFIKDANYFLPSNYNNQKVTKENDIMDVWFDSGTSHSILKDIKFPADLYFEGKDQFRGWFNSSLITSVAYNGLCPYKEILTHGFVLDSQGKKMSKSLGNIIKPLEIFSTYGSDVFRIWCASTDYSNDVKISKDILNQSSEIYRRIRNTMFKFVLGNLNDFDIEKFNLNFSNADKYIINLMNNMLKNVESFYENYDFKNIIKLINMTVIQLSSWYFEYIKDELYCGEIDSPKMNSIKTVLFYILKSFLTILAPIIPHTTDEVYDHWNIKNKFSSIHLENMMKKIEFKNIDLTIDHEKWENFFKFREDIFFHLELARKNKVINKNDEAKIILNYFPKNCFEIDTIKEYLNIFDISVDKNSQERVKIKKTLDSKCDRCWNYFGNENMNESKMLCNRCYLIVKKLI